MKVLIVGGAGYLGGALTDILSGSEHEVTVYDSLVFEDHYLKDTNFVYGDVREHKKLANLLVDTDVVVWLAALVGDGACALNPELTEEINQKAVKWLADNYSGRILFTSTCSVYGAKDGMLNENAPTKPLSVYAATKLKAEEYLANNEAMIFRLGTLYGVSDRHSRIRMDLVANVLTARAFYEGKLKVFGGEQYRPLLHVKDAAQMIADNLTTDNVGIYNLSILNMKILNLAKLVNDAIPCQIEIVETSFEDSRNYKVSHEKARAIGFAPSHSVLAGINEVRELLESGRIKDVNNPRYSNEGYLGVVNAARNS